MDIDECVELDPCSHECINTQGGYSCRCPEGFFLSADVHNCFGRLYAAEVSIHYNTVMKCMLLYVVAVCCMLLYAAVCCCCMLLYAVVCC